MATANEKDGAYCYDKYYNLIGKRGEDERRSEEERRRRRAIGGGVGIAFALA